MQRLEACARLSAAAAAEGGSLTAAEGEPWPLDGDPTPYADVEHL